MIYLCGPINGCTDEECSNWREMVKEMVGCDRCLDPMRRDYRGVEDVAYREIVDLDKLDVRRSSVVLVNFVKPSVGTSMEVFYAWTLGIPVVVVCAEGAVLSPWLRYHATKIEHSFKDAASWTSDTGLVPVEEQC